MVPVIIGVEHMVALTGLSSASHSVTHTGNILVSYNMSVNPGSSAVVTISQSGSASVTTASAIPAKGVTSVSAPVMLTCAPGDTITVSVSSSNPVDQQPNAVITKLCIARTR